MFLKRNPREVLEKKSNPRGSNAMSVKDDHEIKALAINIITNNLFSFT